MLILAIDTSAVASAALVSDDTPESLRGQLRHRGHPQPRRSAGPGNRGAPRRGRRDRRRHRRGGHRGGPRPVHRPALRDRHRPHPRLRLGQAAVRPHEPGRHRPGSGGVHRRGAGVHRRHGRPAQRGLLGPVYPQPTASCRSCWTARTSASPRTCPDLPVYGAGAGIYADVVKAVPEFSSRQPEALSLGQFALARLAAGEQLLDSTPLYLRESDAQVPGPRKRAL